MSKNILRALIVAPTPTWPLNYGNRKRIYSVCKSLKDRGYEIHYIHYASEGDWRDYAPVESRVEMQKQWEIVDHVWPSMPLHDWPKHGDDHQIDEWWDPALENHLQKTLASRTYDAVIVNYTWLSKALDFVPKGALKVLDTHDKFSGRRELLELNGLEKEFFHTTHSEELKGLNRADLVWAIKDEEKVLFEKMNTTAKVNTLLHIDDCRENLTTVGLDSGVTFGFIGANNNVNKTNLLEFFNVAEPIFNKYCPPLTVKIAGSICKELKDLGSNYFESVGYVDSIDEFYDQIHVAITPMEFSTGLKIKVAEALSQKKAVMSHEHAFEGFPATHEFHLCKSFKELALKMCELAYEPIQLDEISKASLKSYALIKSDIGITLDNFHKQVIAKKALLIILPKEYGNEKKIAHWLAKARVDLMSWNVESLTLVKLEQPEPAQSHDKDIRFLCETELNTLIRTCSFDIILNLYDGLNENINLQAGSIVSEVNLPFIKDELVIYTHYLPRVSEENCLPALGHILPPFLDPSLEKLGEFAWVVGDNETLLLSSFTNLLVNTLESEILDVSNFDDLDVLFKKYLVLPKKLIVIKKVKFLNLAEQVLIEICTRYDVSILFSEDFTCLDFEEKGVGKQYETNFFRYWESFVHSLSTLQSRSLI
ncbi:glycosyltransferase [Paraglaciecola sp.]|uniref:glycosyltransferase n=1 Tax=Paraglaciecola sp. TaxID=1920173 RepID=UPI003266301C